MRNPLHRRRRRPARPYEVDFALLFPFPELRDYPAARPSTRRDAA